MVAAWIAPTLVTNGESTLILLSVTLRWSQGLEVCRFVQRMCDANILAERIVMSRDEKAPFTNRNPSTLQKRNAILFKTISATLRGLMIVISALADPQSRLKRSENHSLSFLIEIVQHSLINSGKPQFRNNCGPN
jgi:hypothetical protein